MGPAACYLWGLPISGTMIHFANQLLIEWLCPGPCRSFHELKEFASTFIGTTKEQVSSRLALFEHQFHGARGQRRTGSADDFG